MTLTEFQTLANTIADEVGRLLPEVLQVPEEMAIANGNCVLCIMNEAGDSVIRMYGGSSRLRQRQVAQVATKKAFQVWISGYSTGTYETLVYTGQVDEEAIGIPRPELIGWYGGVAAKTAAGERLAIGFSGVRGAEDVGLVRRAAENLQTFTIFE